MTEQPHIELNVVPHPTDQLITCDDCGESYAGPDMADWVERHLREKHS